MCEGRLEGFFAGCCFSPCRPLESRICYDNQNNVSSSSSSSSATKCEVILLYLMEIWVKNWDRVGLLCLALLSFVSYVCLLLFFLHILLIWDRKKGCTDL